MKSWFLSPRTHIKSHAWWLCLDNSSTRGTLRITSQSILPKVQRHCLKKYGEEQLKEMSDIELWPPYAHCMYLCLHTYKHACVCMLMHTCQHSHTDTQIPTDRHIHIHTHPHTHKEIHTEEIIFEVFWGIN